MYTAAFAKISQSAAKFSSLRKTLRALRSKSFFIQIVVVDVTPDFFGQQRPDVLFIPDAFANECGGNFHNWCVDQVDSGMVFKQWIIRFSRKSWIYVNLMILEDYVIIFPFVQRLEVVFAHNECEFVLREFVLQMRERMHRIIGLLQSEFDIGRLDFWEILGGQVHEFEPQVVAQKRLFFLERIVWRDDHPDLIQAGEFRHVVGDDHVADVDGIERSEVESDFHIAAKFTKFFAKSTKLGFLRDSWRCLVVIYL